MGGRTKTGPRLAELLEAAGLGASVAVCRGGDVSSIRISAVTADSRDVGAGGCFVAVPGTRRDGHDFVNEAVRGGAAAVVSQRSVRVPRGVGAVEVRDARTALARLSAAFHGFGPGQRHAGLTLVGVTGTNGKTTTCTLLRSILSQGGHRTALLGTLAYDLVGETRPAEWTTPPAPALYACLSRAAEFGATHAVMEVSSHALMQSRCDGHRFAVGVFTNLSGDHLDYHKDLDGYAAAKKRLFDGLDACATAVVNGDDGWSDRMVSGCAAEVVRFGFGAGVEVTADVASMDAGGSRFVLRAARGAVDVGLRLTGRHNVANALAAAAVGLALGVDLEGVRRGLESVESIPGRLQRVDTRGLGFTVFVDYAHTDAALAQVLAALRPMTAGRLICVFGCGGDRDRTKRPRMAAAAGAGADRVVVTSDNPRTEDPLSIIGDVLAGFRSRDRRRVHVEADRGRAIAWSIAAARRGDTVLIAGKGHEDYQIVGDKRWHFDDVESAAACLGRREASGHDAVDAG